MFDLTPKKVAIFSASLAAFLLIVFMFALRFRDNEVTGNVISESTEETFTIWGLFIAIAMLVGILTFITVIYKSNNRY